MDAFVFHKYKDTWVFTSAAQVLDGPTLDAHPVRLVAADDRQKLKSVIEELLAEDVPVVEKPDYKDRRFVVGIRTEALNLKNWLAFVKDARAFNLEKQGNELILEEWPKEGGSFSANAIWKKQFPQNQLDKLVEYLIKKTGRKVHSTRADSPAPFGYKMGWLAIRSQKMADVLKALQLSDPVETSWAEGIDTVYTEFSPTRVFVTPAVNGWIMVVGFWAMGEGDAASVRAIAKRITKLSSKFAEVQAFATHRVVEYHHWMRAKKGALIRSFAYLGESGEVLANMGKVTPVEKAFKWDLLEKFKWFPDEQDVMKVAGQWSVNPTTFDNVESTSANLGVIAKTPNKK